MHPSQKSKKQKKDPTGALVAAGSAASLGQPDHLAATSLCV